MLLVWGLNLENQCFRSFLAKRTSKCSWETAHWINISGCHTQGVPVPDHSPGCGKVHSAFLANLISATKLGERWGWQFGLLVDRVKWGDHFSFQVFHGIWGLIGMLKKSIWRNMWLWEGCTVRETTGAQLNPFGLLIGRERELLIMFPQ